MVSGQIIAWIILVLFALAFGILTGIRIRSRGN